MVKNQHYVPQRHLRKFAIATKKKRKDIHRFTIFDKMKAEIRANQNVENYASERYFYDVDFDGLLQEAKLEGHIVDPKMAALIDKVDKQHLENIFAEKVETKMYDPFDRIITKYILTPTSMHQKVSVITEEDRATIAYYLAIQYVRTKEYRERMIQLYEQGAKLLLRKGLGNKIDSDILDDLEIKLKKRNINLTHNEHLLDTNMLESFAQIFLSHIWIFAKNETNSLFYTSDNPLVVYGHGEHHGLASRGIEIVFPITPKLALIMREVEHFKNDLVLHNKFHSIKEDYVNHCNTLQVFQSYNYVFSKNANFKLATELVKNNPSLRNVKKSRYLMG
ncbi:DUF4238 domain-containing protein [Priestia megaterium]|uniref:DUF4238 domain-containing protein n=1 Tax=Priestia megaterium TaxID=1404 RepID=UPI002E2000F4|nr:DUF4238 domain-containing protein [Priestia megaterium]